MECSKAQDALVDLLYQELSPEERARLLAHVGGCAECAERWSRLQTLAATLDRWTPPAATGGIAERAVARIASERTREAPPSGWRRPAADTLRRVGLGLGAALVSLVLVVGVSERQPGLLTIGGLGVLWTLLYGGLFLYEHHPRLQPVWRSALAGAGAALLLLAAVSIPDVVLACARWAQAAIGAPALNPLLVLVAAGYTAVPLLLGGLAVARPSPGSPFAPGAALSMLYALLLAPAVYLQCRLLPLDLALLWVVGAILGAGLAGPGSLWLAGRRRAAPV